MSSLHSRISSWNSPVSIFFKGEFWVRKGEFRNNIRVTKDELQVENVTTLTRSLTIFNSTPNFSNSTLDYANLNLDYYNSKLATRPIVTLILLSDTRIQNNYQNTFNLVKEPSSLLIG